MTTKIKINITEGILEVEGDEKFVTKMYNDFKDNIIVNYLKTTKENQSIRKKPTSTKKTQKETKKKNRTKSKSNIPSVVSDLNLRPKQKKSLDDFVSTLTIKSNLERNTAYLYYLTNILGKSKIDQDHIFTCYRHLKEKIPAALYQSLADTSVKGWIDTSDMEDLQLTSIGLNYVEHDMKTTD